jgi:hypothetical protein
MSVNRSAASLEIIHCSASSYKSMAEKIKKKNEWDERHLQRIPHPRTHTSHEWILMEMG